MYVAVEVAPIADMNPTEANIQFLPVTRSRWSDLEDLFESRGGPNHCWCMVFRSMPSTERRAGGPAKKRALSQMVATESPVGILAYDGDEAVAWCSIAPLETYSNLRTRKYVSDDSDTENVWSIACFYIRRTFRGQGMTTRLIDAAIDYARDNGAKIIEAYPVDYDSPSYTYMGRIGTFKALGFKEIAMAGTRRHIMRLRV